MDLFSIFLYFKYSFLLNSFIYKLVYNLFVHRKKNYQLLICRVAKNLPALELLNHFIKSSTVAYKWVAYKKNLVYSEHLTIFAEKCPWWSLMLRKLQYEESQFFWTKCSAKYVRRNSRNIQQTVKIWTPKCDLNKE